MIRYSGELAKLKLVPRECILLMTSLHKYNETVCVCACVCSFGNPKWIHIEKYLLSLFALLWGRALSSRILKTEVAVI